jgi:hypothetical protein
MSNIFNKLKYFPASCTFCREEGMVFGGYLENGSEVAVCPECANKLILGMDTALKEMARLEKEKESIEPKNEGGAEPVKEGAEEGA